MLRKVGDKVQIRKDLEEDTYCGGIYLDSTMTIYNGKEAEIVKIEDSQYILNIDDGYSYWSDEMFENKESVLVMDMAKDEQPELVWVNPTYESPKAPKPPLGVTPKKIHDTLRIQELCRALYEYSIYDREELKVELMQEWTRELDYLLDDLDIQ